MTIGKQILRGSVLSYGSFLSGKVLTFGSTLILARLLQPADFGLIGYALLVLSFLDVLKNLGVTAALIYRQDVTAVEANETFVLAICTAAILCGICWLLAPAAALFFHNPHITLVTRVLGLSFVLDALGSVHDTLLQKQMRFGRRFVPDLLFNLLKGAVAIGAALAGAGYWSLVWGQLAGITAATMASWWLYPWIPRLRVRWASARQSLRYGMHIILVDVLGAVILSADNLIVGRLLGDSALGLYALSFTIPQMLTINLAVAVSNVVFPAFSTLQHDRDALRRGYLSVQHYSALILLPVGLGLSAITPAFVHALYRPAWWPMIPVMQALAIFATLHALAWSGGDSYKAIGRPDINWKVALVQAPILVSALLVGANLDGIVGVALAHVAVMVPFTVAGFWLIHRVLGVAIVAILRALWAPVVASLAMLACCELVSTLATPRTAPFVVLILQAVAGGAVYCGLVVRFDNEVEAVIRRLLRRSTIDPGAPDGPLLTGPVNQL